MKYLLLFLFSCVLQAQDTPDSFAARVFEACKANDVKMFEQSIAPPAAIIQFIKEVDPSVPDTAAAGVYGSYKAKSLKGFAMWQDNAKELGLDFATTAVLKTEVEERPLKLERDGNRLKPVVVKSVKIFFECSGKKLCFIISDAITVNGNYYIGEENVQLHWLD